MADDTRTREGVSEDELAERIATLVMRHLAMRLDRLAVPFERAGPRLLSFRAAARLLRVDRGSTLHALIRERKIKTVTVAGSVRIPVSEIERIESEGTTQIYSSRRRRARLTPSAAPLLEDEQRRSR